MSNKIKACPACHGTGLRQFSKANLPCAVCEGLGVPIYDEKFGDALSFLEEENHDYIDLDSEDEED